MKWFKFYGQDYLSDPKMLSLSPSERSCWITLLCYASINDNGMITFLSEEQLMSQANLSPLHEEWDNTIGILQKLENMQMIQSDNGKITVTNWQKRQETSLTSYERVKRHREKKRNETKMITIEENRIDKKRIEDKENLTEQSSDKLKNNKNTNMKPYSESSSSDSYELAIDADTGEEITPAKKIKATDKFWELINWSTERRGAPFLKQAIKKQFKAFSIAKDNKIGPSDLKERWTKMENDKFWIKTGFDWMDVVSSFNKKR